MTAAPNGKELPAKLGFIALFGQGFGAMAPPYNGILVGAVVAGFAAQFTPAVFLIAGIGIVFYALMIIYLAGHVQSAGGLYRAVRSGLGPRAGLWYAGALVANGAFSIPATVVSAANLLQLIFAAAFPGVHWLDENWLPLAFMLLCGALCVTYRGAETSGRVIMVILLAGMLAIIGLDLSILAQAGIAHINWSSLSLVSAASGGNAVLMGAGVCLITFSGSEGTVFLSEEAANPRRDIPLSVILGIAFSLVFYVLTALAFVTALPGQDLAHVWGSGGAMVIRTLGEQYVNGWYGYMTMTLIAFAAVAGVISFVNYIARLILALANDALLPETLATTNRFNAPANANTLLAVASLAVFLVGSALVGVSAEASLTLYSWLYVSVSLFLLVGYLIVCIATWRLASRANDSLVRRIVIPGISFVLMLLAAVSQLTPAPPYPFNYAVWTALTVLFGMALYGERVLRCRDPAQQQMANPHRNPLARKST